MAEVNEPVTTTDTPPQGGSSGYTITRKGDQIIEPPATTPAPTATTPPATEPAATTPPATEPAPATPAATEPPATPAATTPEPALEPDEELVDFFPYAAEQTGGMIKSAEDVFALAEEHKKLKQQLAERPKIEFDSEQQRWLYEQCSKVPGKETENFRSMLHILSLDLKSISDKEKQFEAFALENKDFTREEARKFFDARYEKSFGGGLLEDDLVTQFEHRTLTKKAEEVLSKYQEEVSKLPSSKAADVAAPVLTPEDELAIRNDVSRSLAQFGGVKYEFFQNDPASSVNVPLEDADLQKLESYMINPGEFLNDLQQQCLDSKGEFSNDILAVRMFEFLNQDKIREQAFKAGVTYGELKVIKERKNTSTPLPVETPPPAVVEPQTMKDAMRQAWTAKFGVKKGVAA